jgi:ribonuclease P protein component
MGDAAGRRGGARRRGRLSRSADFDRVYRDGRSHASRHLVVYSFPRAGGDGPRLGISVGRKVGGAVTRNHVKRLLRDAFWACADEFSSGHDFVVVARPDMAALAQEQGEPGVEQELRTLLAAAGLGGGEPK